jgi:hypothetical protein
LLSQENLNSLERRLKLLNRSAEKHKQENTSLNLEKCELLAATEQAVLTLAGNRLFGEARKLADDMATLINPPYTKAKFGQYVPDEKCSLNQLEIEYSVEISPSSGQGYPGEGIISYALVSEDGHLWQCKSQKIRTVKEAVNTIKCPRCGGSGKKSQAEIDRDYEKWKNGLSAFASQNTGNNRVMVTSPPSTVCPKCNGTGQIPVSQ